jgi:hypothetical protein
VEDRAELREEYNEMQLEQHHNMESYIIAFKALVNTMREYNVGSAANDEDVLFQFEKGLPAAYYNVKTIRLAQKIDLQASYIFYKTTAKRDETLPGHISTSKKATSSLADTTHATVDAPHATALSRAEVANCRTLLGQLSRFKDQSSYNTNSGTTSTEVCRNYARGKCTKGQFCKYVHPQQPGAPLAPAGPPPAPYQGARGPCYQCGVEGHLRRYCPQRSAPRSDQVRATVGQESNFVSPVISTMRPS